MGQVNARESATPGGMPGATENNASTKKGVVSFPDNPGTMEDLHRKTQEVFPSIWEGIKLGINKQVGNQMQAGHSMLLTNVPQAQGYKFNATYVGDRINPEELMMGPAGPNDLKSLVMGDIDGQGNLSANIMYQLTPSMRSKMVVQMEPFGKPQMFQATTDYRMPNSTASFTCGNINPVQGTGLGVFHYLHKVYPGLSLGTELAVQASPQIPNNRMAVHSLAAKYETDQSTISATASLGGVHASFHRKCTENLQVVSELEINSRVQEAQGALGFQVDIPDANNYSLKAKVDSDWNVHSACEMRLDPLPMTLSFSGLYSLSKNKVKVGVGLQIG